MQKNTIGKKSAFAKKLGPVNTFLMVVVMVLLAVVVVVGVKYLEISNGRVSGESSEVGRVKSQVRSLLSIDDAEIISVLRVEDAVKLKQNDPLFYKDLQNGHYLVALTNAQRLIIFDSQQNRIVNFSNFSVNPQLHDESKINPSEKPLRIEVRFTGKVTAETKKNFMGNLKRLSANYESVEGQSAPTSYSGITLILLNKEKKPKLSENLRSQIAATQGKKTLLESIPVGFDPSTADVLIVVGKPE